MMNRNKLNTLVYNAGNRHASPMPACHVLQYTIDDMDRAGCADDDYRVILDMFEPLDDWPDDRDARHAWVMRACAIQWGFRHLGVHETLDVLRIIGPCKTPCQGQ